MTAKRVQEMEKYKEAGEELPAEFEVKTKSFKDDAKWAYCVLKVMLKSKASKLVKVHVQLEVADNEAKNVRLPVTPMFESVFSNEDKQAFVFLKIDPSKQGWGEVNLKVLAEFANTTSVTTSATMGTATNYSSVSYAPVGDDP